MSNKLWCESTINPAPELCIAASCSFSKLTKNVIRSSRGHSTPSQKISCKLVQLFSCNLADKEINKETNKEIDRKQYPIPDTIAAGVISIDLLHFIKVTIRPEFFGTVPNFEGPSQKNYEVIRDAELSRIPNPVPNLSRFNVTKCCN